MFNDTKVTISGLNPVTTYRFQVFADNGVSDQVPLAEHSYIDIAVTTEASVPSSVSNVSDWPLDWTISSCFFF